MNPETHSRLYRRAEHGEIIQGGAVFQRNEIWWRARSIGRRQGFNNVQYWNRSHAPLPTQIKTTASPPATPQQIKPMSLYAVAITHIPRTAPNEVKAKEKILVPSVEIVADNEGIALMLVAAKNAEVILKVEETSDFKIMTRGVENG